MGFVKEQVLGDGKGLGEGGICKGSSFFGIRSGRILKYVAGKNHILDTSCSENLSNIACFAFA